MQGYKVVIVARGNGSLSGSAFSTKDKGRWWIKGNRLCVAWSNWTSGKATCGHIKRAGSFTRRADKSQVRLVNAGGAVYSGKSAMKTQVELGDIIVVPTRIEREKNWFKTMSTILSATTAALTSVYIVGKL